MKPEVIRETVMRFAADEWRAINHAMCKPWQNAAGVAMATDGRIAICYHGAHQGMFETGCMADRAWSERVLGWIRDDKADADKGLRPAIPLDFCLLARRHGVRQEIRNNWYVETIDSFRVTVTNDTIFMEIGGAK